MASAFRLKVYLQRAQNWIFAFTLLTDGIPTGDIFEDFFSVTYFHQ